MPHPAGRSMTGALTCRAHTVVNRPKPGAYSAVAPSKPRQVVTQSGFSSQHHGWLVPSAVILSVPCSARLRHDGPRIHRAAISERQELSQLQPAARKFFDLRNRSWGKKQDDRA